MAATDSRWEQTDHNMSKGFTLVEFLVAIALVSLIAGAIVSLFTTLSRSYTTQNVSADVQQSARIGIDLMAQDIRVAGLDPLQTAGAAFGEVSSTSIEFTADNDMSGAIDTTSSLREHITYFFNGSQLMRQLNGEKNTNQPLINNVKNLAFSYLDGSGAQTTDPAQIIAVDISLTVEEPAGRDQPVQRTYSTRVRCRNLGL
jgi:prepilin-type N-terminal cleavage/methylation domain-containing protein